MDVKSILSKLWDIIKDDVYANIKKVASMFISAIAEEAKTPAGRYNIIVAIQMISILATGLLTIAFGFTSAIYGAAIVLFFQLSTRHIHDDSITLYLKSKLNEIEVVSSTETIKDTTYDNDTEVRKSSIKDAMFVCSRYVTYIGLLHVVLCLLVDIIIRHKNIEVGIISIILCLVIVICDLLLDKVTKEYVNSDAFELFATSIAKLSENVTSALVNNTATNNNDSTATDSNSEEIESEEDNS